MATDSTLSAMFWARVAADADGPAQLVKHAGAWTTLSWRQVGDRVRELLKRKVVAARYAALLDSLYE